MTIFNLFLDLLNTRVYQLQYENFFRFQSRQHCIMG